MPKLIDLYLRVLRGGFLLRFRKELTPLTLFLYNYSYY